MKGLKTVLQKSLENLSLRFTQCSIDGKAMTILGQAIAIPKSFSLLSLKDTEIELVRRHSWEDQFAVKFREMKIEELELEGLKGGDVLLLKLFGHLKENTSLSSLNLNHIENSGSFFLELLKYMQSSKCHLKTLRIPSMDLNQIQIDPIRSHLIKTSRN